MRSLLNKTAFPILAGCVAERDCACSESKIENRKSRIQNRPAFTLVELLVSITILVILTGLVLVAFQRDDTDRLSASARMLQSYFEGARSRAINDGQLRGVRLIRSENDPATVDTLAYIGSPGFVEGSCNIGVTASGSSQWVVVENGTAVWQRLVSQQVSATGRSLLVHNSRIEIPAFSGQWYTVSIGEDLNGNGSLDVGLGEDFDGDTNLDYTNASGRLMLALRSHYLDSRRNASNNWEPNTGTEAVDYRLALAPTILANTEPVKLDAGIVIDLDASKLPAAWRPNLSTNTRYADSLDILFDSRGSPTGPLVASGLIHLYLTTLQDVELTRGQDPTHPQNGTGAPAGNWPFVPIRAPIVPKVEPVVLNLFTQGGQVTTSSIATLPARTLVSDPPNTWAADPFSYARRGQEAQ